jgi:hypothetical protein
MIGALAALPVASAPILAGAAAMANAAADKAYENYKPLYDAVGPWPGVTVEMSFGLVGEKPTAYNAVTRSDLVRWLDSIDPRHADKIREQTAQILRGNRSAYLRRRSELNVTQNDPPRWHNLTRHGGLTTLIERLLGSTRRQPCKMNSARLSATPRMRYWQRNHALGPERLPS